MEQLKNCPCIPCFYISIDGWRREEKNNSILYTVEIGMELEDHILVLQTEKRYSELRKLHISMISHFSGKFSFTPFPPKSFFNQNDLIFIRNRQKALQEYCHQISMIDGITRFPPFVDFFQYKRMKEIWTKESTIFETALTPYY